MSDLAAWNSFYVIVGSSAGALTGLQFVVMTLIAEKSPPRSAEARPRICDANNRTLWYRVAFVSSSLSSMAGGYISRRYSGSHGPERSSVHDHRGWANESTNRI